MGFGFLFAGFIAVGFVCVAQNPCPYSSDIKGFLVDRASSTYMCCPSLCGTTCASIGCERFSASKCCPGAVFNAEDAKVRECGGTIKAPCAVMPEVATAADDAACGAADVVFALDGSASLSASDWKRQLAFLGDVARRLKPSSDGVRVGVVQFGKSTKIEQGASSLLTSWSSAKANIKQFTSSGRMDQVTNIEAAMRGSVGLLETAGRWSDAAVTKIVVLVTDGKGTTWYGNPDVVGVSNEDLQAPTYDRNAASAPAAEKESEAADAVVRNRLRAMAPEWRAAGETGVLVYAVGVGDAAAIDSETLTLLSSAPHAEHTLVVADYSALATAVRATASFLCPVSEPPPLCKPFIDLVFVVDTSGSVQLFSPEAQTFVNGVIDALVIDAADGASVAVRSFSGDARWHDGHVFHTTTAAARGAVEKVPAPKGSTALADAMRGVADALGDASNRAAAPDVVLFFTDGEETVDKNKTRVIGESALIKATPAEVTVVAVTDGLSEAGLGVLTSVASDAAHFISVTSASLTSTLRSLPFLTQCDTYHECFAQPAADGGGGDGASAESPMTMAECVGAAPNDTPLKMLLAPGNYTGDDFALGGIGSDAYVAVECVRARADDACVFEATSSSHRVWANTRQLSMTGVTLRAAAGAGDYLVMVRDSGSLLLANCVVESVQRADMRALVVVDSSFGVFAAYSTSFRGPTELSWSSSISPFFSGVEGVQTASKGAARVTLDGCTFSSLAIGVNLERKELSSREMIGQIYASLVGVSFRGVNIGVRTNDVIGAVSVTDTVFETRAVPPYRAGASVYGVRVIRGISTTLNMRNVALTLPADAAVEGAGVRVEAPMIDYDKAVLFFENVRIVCGGRASKQLGFQTNLATSLWLTQSEVEQCHTGILVKGATGRVNIIGVRFVNNYVGLEAAGGTGGKPIHVHRSAFIVDDDTEPAPRRVEWQIVCQPAKRLVYYHEMKAIFSIGCTNNETVSDGYRDSDASVATDDDGDGVLLGLDALALGLTGGGLCLCLSCVACAALLAVVFVKRRRRAARRSQDASYSRSRSNTGGPSRLRRSLSRSGSRHYLRGASTRGLHNPLSPRGAY